MELGKDALQPGVRPKVGMIKGSATVSYDSSANISVYNDFKDFSRRATLVWEDPNDLEEFENEAGVKGTRPKKKPVVELGFDKSKIYKGFDGVIYFKLDPPTGRFEECRIDEQRRYWRIAYGRPAGSMHANPPVRFLSTAVN